MRDDDFLGHPGGSGPGRWMVESGHMVGPGEVGGHVAKPLMQIGLSLQALHWLVLQFQ